MINKIKIWFISELLRRANAVNKSDEFYALKREILVKYGQTVGIHIQFIPGKKCNSCAGTGTFPPWVPMDDRDTCYVCDGDGWYKKPVWNVLALKRIGKLEFHKPIIRLYKKPDYKESKVVKFIDGYIEHEYERFGVLSEVILFLLFKREYLRDELLFLKWRFQMIYREIRHDISSLNNEIKTHSNEYEFDELPF